MKISADLISGLESSTTRRQLVESVIRLSGKFGLKAIAVDVKRPEQIEILTSLGCNLIQGEAVSKPLSPREAELHLRDFELQL